MLTGQSKCIGRGGKEAIEGLFYLSNVLLAQQSRTVLDIGPRLSANVKPSRCDNIADHFAVTKRVGASTERAMFIDEALKELHGIAQRCYKFRK